MNEMEVCIKFSMFVEQQKLFNFIKWWADWKEPKYFTLFSTCKENKRVMICIEHVIELVWKCWFVEKCWAESKLEKQKVRTSFLICHWSSRSAPHPTYTRYQFCKAEENRHPTAMIFSSYCVFKALLKEEVLVKVAGVKTILLLILNS